METGKPRKHRSLLDEYLKKLETRKEPMKAVDKTEVHAPVDVDKKKQDLPAQTSEQDK